MKSLILPITIFFILLVTFISCEEKAVTTESENINYPPDIVEIILSPEPPLDLSVQDRIEIQTIAVDPNGDDLSYFWECSGVLEQPIGAPDHLTVMQVSSTGDYIVRCFVSDGENTTIDSVIIGVIDNSIVLPESNLNYTDHLSYLFQVRCGSENGCHSHLNTGGPPARGLDITDYDDLINHIIDDSTNLIIPGQGEQSFLYKILLGPVSGRPQMPKDRPPLNSNNTNGIRGWIDEGAPEFGE
jgi:hypothetical protein